MKKICILAYTILLFLTIISKSYASNCTSISNDNIKYANSTLTKINIDEYNAYQRGISKEEYNNLSINEKYELDESNMLFGSKNNLCVAGIQNGFINRNEYANLNAALPNLAKKTLINDNLYIIDRYLNSNSLFPKQNTNPQIYENMLINWRFPFVKEQDGYYVFDSSKYHVYKNYNNKTLELHQGTKNGFYPFNNCNDDTSNSVNRNLGFTTRIDIPFIMTNDGRIKNSMTGQYEDMMLEFSGNDDIWVYVDDELLVDLGGNHQNIKAKVNLPMNRVYYDGIYDVVTKNIKYNVAKSALASGVLKPGEHTLKIFYISRAGNEANFFTKFNLQSAGLKVNYIEKETGKIINQEYLAGGIGDTIRTIEKTFDGYTLLQKPSKEEYILTENLQEVNYYYSKNYQITAKYIDELTGNEIAESVTITGKSGQTYKLEQKQIEGYGLTRIEGIPEGIITENNIVTYYYKHQAKVTVNYIDIDSQEKIGIFEKLLFEGDTLITEERNYEDYILVQKPENPIIQIGKEDIVLEYYYKKINFNLQVELNMEKAIVNGFYKALSGKFGKIETELNEANKNSTLKIYYKARVTNNSEKDGNGYITFTIPDGYTLLNSDWTINQNIATYKIENLSIGETRDYEIIIEKNKNIDITGKITALIRVDSEKWSEVTLDDNEDKVDLVVMPRTGQIILSVLPIVVILVVIAIIIIKKLRKNKKVKLIKK